MDRASFIKMPLMLLSTAFVRRGVKQLFNRTQAGIGSREPDNGRDRTEACTGASTRGKRLASTYRGLMRRKFVRTRIGAACRTARVSAVSYKELHMKRVLLISLLASAGLFARGV